MQLSKTITLVLTLVTFKKLYNPIRKENTTLTFVDCFVTFDCYKTSNLITNFKQNNLSGDIQSWENKITTMIFVESVSQTNFLLLNYLFHVRLQVRSYPLWKNMKCLMWILMNNFLVFFMNLTWFVNFPVVMPNEWWPKFLNMLVTLGFQCSPATPACYNVA